MDKRISDTDSHSRYKYFEPGYKPGPSGSSGGRVVTSAAAEKQKVGSAQPAPSESASEQVREQRPLSDMNPREQRIHDLVEELFQGENHNAAGTAPEILDVCEDLRYHNILQSVASVCHLDQNASAPDTSSQIMMDNEGMVTVWENLRDAAKNPRRGQQLNLDAEYRTCARALKDNISQLGPQQGLYFLFGSQSAFNAQGNHSKMVRVFRNADNQLELMLTKTDEENSSGQRLVKLTASSAVDMARYLMFLATLANASEVLLLCNSNTTLKSQNLFDWQSFYPVADALPLLHPDDMEATRVSRAVARALGLKTIEPDDRSARLPALVQLVAEGSKTAGQCYLFGRPEDISCFQLMDSILNREGVSSRQTTMVTHSCEGLSMSRAQRAEAYRADRERTAARILEFMHDPKHVLVHFRCYIQYKEDEAPLSLESLYLLQDGKDYYLVSADHSTMPILKTSNPELMKTYITYVLQGDRSNKIIIEPYTRRAR